MMLTGRYTSLARKDREFGYLRSLFLVLFFVVECYFHSGVMWGQYDDSKSKLGLAKKCIKNILDQLREGDCVGLVTFTHTQEVLVPLTPVERLDKVQIKKMVQNLRASGGTALQSG